MGRRRQSPIFSSWTLLLRRSSSSSHNNIHHDAKSPHSRHDDDDEEDASVFHIHHKHHLKWNPMESERTVDTVVSLTEEEPVEEVEAPVVEAAEAASSSPTTAATTSSSASSSVVSFGTVHVRVYNQVLGDHPFCSAGCPIQLGWNYHELPPIQVQTSHSSSSSPTTRMEDLKLSPEERRRILLLDSPIAANTVEDQASPHPQQQDQSQMDAAPEEQRQDEVSSTCGSFQSERELARECRRLNRKHANDPRHHLQKQFFFGNHRHNKL